jgi:hypothetical protein
MKQKVLKVTYDGHFTSDVLVYMVRLAKAVK